MPNPFAAGKMSHSDLESEDSRVGKCGASPMAQAAWPELPYAAWKDTYATLHLWTQIVGKIRLAQTPWLNHSWHVVLYVSARGLTTSPFLSGSHLPARFRFPRPCAAGIDQRWRPEGDRSLPALRRRLLCRNHALLAELGIEVRINELPNEIPDAIRFSEDHVHASYDRDYAERHWRVLLQVNRVLHEFRTSFIGKCSPVHFFWGSFDLAVTRFRPASALIREACQPSRRRGARGLFA